MTRARARGTSNANARGSSTDRHRRKLWLLATFGDGETAPCSLRVHPDCLMSVSYDTITADRHPTPGAAGGTYRRGNIRPACPVCNASDGGRLGVRRKREKAST